MGAQYRYPAVFENDGAVNINFFEFDETSSKIFNIFISKFERLIYLYQKS